MLHYYHDFNSIDYLDYYDSTRRDLIALYQTETC